MEGAVRSGVDGIDADCGGALSCSTCHVYVADDWIDLLVPPSQDEKEMIDFAVDPKPCSRLSCQIVMKSEYEGLVLNVPATQR